MIAKKRKRTVIQVTPTTSPAKPSPAKKKAPSESPSAKRSVMETKSPKSPMPKKRKTIDVDEKSENNSDSDISVLIDATPPTSKSRKPKEPKATKGKDNKSASKYSKSASVATSKPSTSADDEIKHLKSLVFKCGVRKNWYSIRPRSYRKANLVGQKNSHHQCRPQNKYHILRRYYIHWE